MNFFQSETESDMQYKFNSLLHSLFHYNLECLVILTYLEYLFQRFSVINVNSYTILSNNSLSGISAVLMLSSLFLSLLMKFSSFSLFLIMVCYLSWINFLLMIILTMKEVWLERLCKLGKIVWVFISSKLTWRNIKSITELYLLGLLVYLVRTWLIDIDNSKSNELVISLRVLVYIE